MKENDYTRSFMCITLISLEFWIRSKVHCQVATTHPTPNFFTKMAAKDDPTISCSHLVAETRVLVGRGKKKGEALSVDEGYLILSFPNFS